MLHKKFGNIFIIRLEKGEEIITTLSKFLSKKKISSAFFSGIGAVEKAVIGFYDLNEKKYFWREFMECEVVSLSGNVSILDDRPFIHSHVVLSDISYNCFGGHLREATAGATLEIKLEMLDGKIARKFDTVTGLNLLDL